MYPTDYLMHEHERQELLRRAREHRMVMVLKHRRRVRSSRRRLERSQRLLDARQARLTLAEIVRL
ncbi:MAG: hypothetical protein ACK5MT_08655 [Actinomycetales bacterium]